MKTIGILGGTSWPSTMSPYATINASVAERLGDNHSARIILYSIDYDPIKSLYHHSWDKIPGLLKKEIEFVAALKPDCLFLANNTLHKAFDIVENELALSMPFFHAVRLTAKELKERNSGKTLFLGTAFTMEDDFFVSPLRKTGVDIVIPNAEERATIQIHQSKLAKNEKSATTQDFFANLLSKYEKENCATVVLACTELPLAIDPTITKMRIVDPLSLQCRAAVDFALGEFNG